MSLILSARLSRVEMLQRDSHDARQVSQTSRQAHNHITINVTFLTPFVLLVLNPGPAKRLIVSSINYVGFLRADNALQQRSQYRDYFYAIKSMPRHIRANVASQGDSWHL
jgi:hypothetical protein